MPAGSQDHRHVRVGGGGDGCEGGVLGHLLHLEGQQRYSYFNENLEVAELKYQQALKRLKRAYPEDFCGWGTKSAEYMAAWAVDLEKGGFPIAAAQQAAKALGLKTRESADCMPGCACAGCA